jgi:hypothetical protein
MVTTIAVLNVIIIVLSVIFLDPDRLSAVFAMLVGSQLIMNVVANSINHPVEWGVKQYYINDAKTDYYHARSIVNGMSSNPQKYTDDALAYVDKLNSREESVC